MKKLIWLTDLHLVEQGQDWPQGVDPLARLRTCLEEVSAFHRDAELIVISGDLIQLRNPGAYDILHAELERVGIPYRLLVGNHDDRRALISTFPEANRVGSFIQGVDDIDDARFIYLDTLAADGKHHGELCSLRMQWLDEQIRQAGERPVLIFLHHPPCNIGVPALDRLKLLDSEGLAKLLRQLSSPAHLFFGHLHRNVCGLWAGHPFASLKSTHVQFDLDMVGSKLVRSEEPPGFAVIQVDQSNITVNYRDISPLSPRHIPIRPSADRAQ